MDKKNPKTKYAIIGIVAAAMCMSCCCCSSAVLLLGKDSRTKEELAEPTTSETESSSIIQQTSTEIEETEPQTISDITNAPEQVTEANEHSFIIHGYEKGEYSRTVIINGDTDLGVSYVLNKLPAGKYKAKTVEEKEFASFSVVKDCISVDYKLPYPETLDYVESYNIQSLGKTEVEFSLNGDESILMECDKDIQFTLEEPSTEIVYYLFSGEVGDYGRIITLNANTDLPIDKYLYKLPAGKYTATTTFNKLTSFYIVKDNTTTEDNPDYPEILDIVSEPYQLTAGDNDFNGNAKKEVEFELKDDESIVIPETDKGKEFIIRPKE